MKENLPPYTNSHMEHLIDEHIHDKRTHRILKLRLIDGVHFEPLAEEVDMSVTQVKRIVKRETSNLTQYL